MWQQHYVDVYLQLTLHLLEQAQSQIIEDKYCLNLVLAIGAFNMEESFQTSEIPDQAPEFQPIEIKEVYGSDKRDDNIE